MLFQGMVIINCFHFSCSMLDTNQESFFKDLGLLKYLNNNLALSSVLEISENTVYRQLCESLKDLPLHYIRRLISCNLSSSYAAVFDKKTGLTERVNVNPLDLTTALLRCSDPYVQQTLCSKMSQCQLAVPLLLPNLHTQHHKEQSTLMLWALRDIVKTFKLYVEDVDVVERKASLECRIAERPMPMVSFVRLGKSHDSKSIYLNKMLSECNNTFVHFNMECGNVPRKISDGLVEISWYMPCGSSTIDVFDQPIAFANLRGDIRLFEAQFSFLCQTSVAVFVFINDSENDDWIFRGKKGAAVLHLVITAQTSEQKANSLPVLAKKLNMTVDQVITKGNSNEAEFVNTLRSYTSNIIKKQADHKSVEQMANVAREVKILVDEDKPACKHGQQCVKDIAQSITDIAQFKDENLPCQGSIWEEISKLEKEQCQLTKSGLTDIEHYKIELNKKVKNLREKQRRSTLNEALTIFIDEISRNEIKRSYFIKSLKIYLDTVTQKKMSEFQKNLMLEYNTEKNPENILQLEMKIRKGSLGIEHFFRELGQLYEAESRHREKSGNQNIKRLPSVCAQLLLDGYPLELLDGNVSNIPLKWIKKILGNLHNLVHNSKIAVVTILGVQSTGKSTLLNTMFGVQFAVSSGKCTRGAFMQLVKVSDSFKEDLNCNFIMIIDTEGLKSPELAKQIDSYAHDNELATLVIGVSDVTIVNLSMENTAEMKDILQIAVHAFLRMKEVKKKPRCLFVHQNVPDLSAYENNFQHRKTLIEELNEMTKAAARMESRESNTKFTDVMDYDPERDSYYIPGLWQGTPSMASVSASYSEAVYELKKGLITSLKEMKSQKQDIVRFGKLTKDLWKAVRFENFIFNFRNSLVAEAYSKLCQEWDKWEWEFQKEMYKWGLNAEARISNYGMTESSPQMPTLNELISDASDKLDKEEEKIQNCLQQYFDSDASNLCLVEKYRSEFEISVISLKKKTQSSLETSLKAALDVQNGKKQLKVIYSTQAKTMETNVLELLKSCKGKRSPDDQTDDLLSREFDKMWKKSTSQFQYPVLCRKNVATDAFYILQRSFTTFPGDIKRLLIEENLPECGKQPFKVNKASKGQKILSRFRIHPLSWMPVERNIDILQNKANAVIYECRHFISDKVRQKQDYKPDHLHELLHKVDVELQKHESYLNEKCQASLKMHIFGIAIREFQTMHDTFVDQNDPQKCLERAKEKFYSEFVNLFHDQDRCHRKAEEFAKNCLQPAVLDYVTKRIGPEIVDEMKTGQNGFIISTRSSFQYNLLLELLEKNRYEDYKKFIQSYETYVQDWIFDQIVQKMSGGKLQKKEKNLLHSILKGLTEVIASKASSPSTAGTVEAFINDICNTLDLVIPEDALRDFMLMKTTYDSKTNELARHLKDYVEDMRQSLTFSYEDKEQLGKRIQSLHLRPQKVMFDTLFGCGKQCPFCSAPCEAGGTEHTKHFSSIHRPQGTSMWHIIQTKVLITDICSSSVISDRTFRSKETNYTFHPYKDYRKFYSEWDIPGDSTIEATAYWKFFMANYNDQIAQDSDLQPANIPDDWKELSKEDAVNSLKQSFFKI